MNGNDILALILQGLALLDAVDDLLELVGFDSVDFERVVILLRLL